MPTDTPLSAHLGEPHSSAAVPPAVLWCMAIAAGLLLTVAGEGPDFGHYSDWAAAALSGDIFTLRGNVLSPGVVPFTLAAAGPGLIFAVAKSLLVPVTLGAASLLAGWLAALMFWCGALVVLRRVAGGDAWLTIFGAAILFVGTHAGFYSHIYATEVFANALIAALWALALTPRRWRVADGVLVGALTGLLLLVRAHVVLYALPAVWIAVFGSERVPNRARWREVARRLIAVAVPGVIALGEYVVVNGWMTGSLLHPPYVYGGDGFSSVDLSHPEFAAVLVHPWHGLLAYHPVYGIALVALAVLTVTARAWRPLWGVTLLTAVAHIWVQAGWYIWWLGGSSFGMRGMAPAALPLVAGVIALIRQESDAHPGRARAWTLAVAVACTWSYPLLWRGNTNILSWGELMSAQRVAVGAMVLVATVLVAMWWRQSARAAYARTVRSSAIAGLAAAVVYLAWQVMPVPRPAIRIAIGLVAAVVVFIASRRWQWTEPAASRPAKQTPLLLVAAALAVFTLQAVLFTRLTVRTREYQASSAAPPRAFEYAGASPVDELRVTYAEYLAVPGFAPQKAAFRRFLAWQWIAVANLSAADRQVSTAVSERLLADPAFGEGIVEVRARHGVVEITGSGISDGQQSRARDLALAIPGVQSVTFLPN